MTGINNTGSAILLSAIMWFGYHYGFSIQLLILGLLPLLTWLYVSSKDTDLTRRLIEAKTEAHLAEARYTQYLLDKERKQE